MLENITGPYMPPLFEVDEATVLPKMIWGYHCRLEEDAKIPRRTLIELANFYVVSIMYNASNISLTLLIIFNQHKIFFCCEKKPAICSGRIPTWKWN